MTLVDSTATVFSTFEGKRPIFRGMEAHYRSDVVPVLERMDKERQSTLETAFICQGILTVIGLALTILFAYSANVIGMTAVIILTIALMIFTWKASTSTFVTHAKTALIGGVIAFFDWTYSASCEDPKIFSRLGKLKLFNFHDSSTFKNQIKGIAFDRSFTFTEIFLTRTDTSTRTDHNGHTQTDTRIVTVFDGCLISIGINEKFSGETIVLRQGFLFNPKKVKGLKKVGLVSSKFENVFNAYSSDQVESRYLLPPTLIEQIIAYENAFKGKNIRFAFIDQQLHIVVETGERFGFKNLSDSLMSQNRIGSLLREIEATFDLIEGLLTKAPDDWKDEFGLHPFLTNQEISSSE